MPSSFKLSSKNLLSTSHPQQDPSRTPYLQGGFSTLLFACPTTDADGGYVHVKPTPARLSLVEPLPSSLFHQSKRFRQKPEVNEEKSLKGPREKDKSNTVSTNAKERSNVQTFKSEPSK